jgi:hypothetical protein
VLPSFWGRYHRTKAVLRPSDRADIESRSAPRITVLRVEVHDTGDVTHVYI